MAITAGARTFGLLLASLLFLAPPAWAVGFQRLSITDPGHDPLVLAIWYPSDETPTATPLPRSDQLVAPDGAIAGNGLPLIVISHGALASFLPSHALAEHIDTALALAQSGFVVVALVHNEYAEGPVIRVKDRNRQLHRLLDFMLAEWPGHARLDPARIGALGYSLGGFSVLVALGGEPDLALIAPHCAVARAEWSCTHDRLGIYHDPPDEPWVHDPRIKAAVVAAPALGYLFGRAGLADVHAPVQLWRAGRDRTLAEPWNAAAVARDLPAPPEILVAKGADHNDFEAPCRPAEAKAMPALCGGASRFDRVRFHVVFNKAVLAFFVRTLAPP